MPAGHGGIEFMLHSVESVSNKPKGTILFEEFERALPNFSALSERRELEFTRAIKLLLDRFQISEPLPEGTACRQIQNTLAELQRAYHVDTELNAIIASAIFVVMAHIESSYLDDEDGKLVHKLTSLHIERAHSIQSSAAASQ